MYAKDDSPAFLQQSSYLIDKAAFLEEGDWGAEGERGQWPIQRAGGAARNEQATGREHATIEYRGTHLSPEKRGLAKPHVNHKAQSGFLRRGARGEPIFLLKEGFPHEKNKP